MASRFSVESVFKAIDRVTVPVKKMQARVNKFSRAIQRGFRNANRAVNKFGKSLKRVGVIGAAGLATLGFAMVNIIRIGAQFEQTLVNAAAKFPGEIRKGTEAFRELEDVARRVGATTEFTAIQAAEGLEFLALAGFNAKQSMAALPGVVDLATAANIDLGTASDIATDSLSAFGLASKDTTQLAKNLARVNDVLAKTSVTANTSITDLFEAVSKGAADFTTAGQSIETFSALAGVMANSGKKASEAGTALRNMMLSLAKPTGEAGKLIQKLGIRTQDNEGNFRDAIDILADFEKATKDMGTAQKSAALKTIFGKRTIGAVSILLREGTENLRKYRDTLESAGGAASEMAGVMRDTLIGRLNSLKSAFEGVIITIFKLKDTALGSTIERITAFVRKIDEAINANKALSTEMIDGILKTVAGAIGLFAQLVALFVVAKTVTTSYAAATIVATVATGAYNVVLAFTQGLIMSNAVASNLSKTATLAWVIGIKAATVAQWLWNAALTANPIGLVIAAVGALIAVGVLLIKNWDSIVAAISSAVDAIQVVLKVLFAPISAIIEGLSSVLGVASFFGFGGDEEEKAKTKEGQDAAPQIISPQDRLATTLSESREVSTAEVTIKDETGRAEMTQRGKAPGVNLKLANSGAF